MDTDFLVALLRGHREAVEKAREYDSAGVEVSTTSVNAFEIYLGAFRSREAERNVKSMPVIEALAEKYNAPGRSCTLTKDGKALVRMVFGSITPQSSIKPKNRREIEKIKDELVLGVEEAGGRVEEVKIFEEENEWYTVDPSLIAKSPYKDSEALKWEWII